jgi:hypothetical protein
LLQPRFVFVHAIKVHDAEAGGCICLAFIFSGISMFSFKRRHFSDSLTALFLLCNRVLSGISAFRHATGKRNYNSLVNSLLSAINYLTNPYYYTLEHRAANCKAIFIMP